MSKIDLSRSLILSKCERLESSGDSPQARLEARLEGLTHAIEKSFN